MKVHSFINVLVMIGFVNSQNWVSSANLRNFQEYWESMMQELMQELENREWCNLKLNDITQSIDDNLFNMRVTGTVHYTKGFVVSIQKIDITNILQSVASRTIDGVSVPFGTVRGRINFRDLMVGFNVYANLTSPAGEYRATGTFLHTLAQIELDVTRNLLTKEYSSSPVIWTVTAGSGVRMQYLPASNITEALSRRFSHSTTESARNWAVNTFVPIILDIAENKLEYPEVCFNNCT